MEEKEYDEMTEEEIQREIVRQEEQYDFKKEQEILEGSDF